MESTKYQYANKTDEKNCLIRKVVHRMLQKRKRKKALFYSDKQIDVRSDAYIVFPPSPSISL